MGEFNIGDKVIIVHLYHGAGRTGEVVGVPAIGRDYHYWIPVLFDDEDDPTFFKDGGLNVLKSVAEKAKPKRKPYRICASCGARMVKIGYPERKWYCCPVCHGERWKPHPRKKGVPK